MKIVPITQRDAKAWIDKVHRHLDPPVGDIIRVALTSDGIIVGVGVAGRPGARGLQDGTTIEVTRVAVLEGYPNACSIIYGALRRAAKSLGWQRVVTYTRADEPGSSVKAAGFRLDGHVRGRDWSCRSRPRKAVKEIIDKNRWMWP